MSVAVRPETVPFPVPLFGRFHGVGKNIRGVGAGHDGGGVFIGKGDDKKERQRRYTSAAFSNPDFVLPKEGFVRLPVVLKILGISKTMFYEGIKCSTYPKPLKLGPRTSVWRVEDIREVIDRFKNHSYPEK